ncbi:MAG: helix-hairpin-helix domain-containing protein [Candidatus Micrarchaeota archaeon]|nr:helix-hairpin-helix domain-containing protein [Candidatus Micrarchaeota archaeon]
MGTERKVRIAVDSREPDEICDFLEACEAEIELRSLELGDYQISDEAVVERKTRQDFEASIIDGRLFSQIADLSASVKRVVVVVEGESSVGSRLSKAAILGAYSSLILDFGCSLFFTRSPQATAELVYALACHEQLARKRLFSVFAKRKAISVAQQQRAVVEALPNVGPKLARELLSYFDTVENVITAPESELAQVGRLGKKRAAEIRKILSTRYKE